MLFSSQTPLRVSFFGGGTDYPEYFRRHRGAVLGMSIDKYTYISVLPLSAPLDYRYRVSYSKLETVSQIQEIEHPVVREVLRFLQVDQALDINIMSDLPASSGLGSSSSFTVGFIHLISALQNLKFTKFDLAQKAIHLEREILKERVGVQDQLHVAFGGLNRFDFDKDDRFRITPIQIHGSAQELLSRSMVLVFTGKTRYASQTLKEQIDSTVEKKLDADLKNLLDMVDEAVQLFEREDASRLLIDLGRMLDESWKLKQGLSSKMSNSVINELYDLGMQNGALGGKLCGAGGGGFFLFIVPEEVQKKFAEAVAPARVVPIRMDNAGSRLWMNWV